MSGTTPEEISEILGIILPKLPTNIDKNDKPVQKEVGHEGVTNVRKYVQRRKQIIFMSSSSSSDSNSSCSDEYNKSSEDEEENERENEKCVNRLDDISIDYKILNEMLQKEKHREIEEKIIEIKSGKAKEISEPLKKLLEKRNNRLEVIDSKRSLKLQNVYHKFNGEDQSIDQSFENDKEMLFDSFEERYKAQIKELNDARNEVDIDTALWMGRSLTRSGRGRGRHPYEVDEPKTSPILTSGPCIVYMLKEEEILEDWAAIKKMTLTSERNEKNEKNQQTDQLEQS